MELEKLEKAKELQIAIRHTTGHIEALERVNIPMVLIKPASGNGYDAIQLNTSYFSKDEFLAAYMIQANNKLEALKAELAAL